MQTTIKPILTDIILIDIIGYSKLNNTQQFKVVNIMTKFFKKAIELMLKKSRITESEAILGFIATGDGFFIILSEKLKGYGVILALSLKNISKNIKMRLDFFQGIKVAVHYGEVMEFRDILNHKNFIGDGLNNCARYLDYKTRDKNVLKHITHGYVIISEEASHEFNKFLQRNRKIFELLNSLEFQNSDPFGFNDKHKYPHYGCFVWTKKEVVITPP